MSAQRKGHLKCNFKVAFADDDFMNVVAKNGKRLKTVDIFDDL
ncbi:MAG: hypothetical protein WA125_01960 [Desulfosporosinus sp.]